MEKDDIRDQTNATSAAVDRRRNLRVGLAVLRIREEGHGKTFFGYATNVSRGGMFIRSENPRQIGERFLVEMPFPAPLQRRICCTCEVVWRRMHTAGAPHPAGMGLRFVDVSESDAEAIDQWVRLGRDGD